MKNKDRTIAVALGAVLALCIGGGIAIATSNKDETSTSATPGQHPRPVKLPGPFSGHGNKTLGKLVIPAAGAELYWHGHLALTNAKSDRHRLRVGAAKSGQRYVAAGTYHNVVVHANGDWTIKFGKRLVLR